MKKATKAIVIALCAVLLVAGSVMGTLAWLTSTASVKNTFTVGKVAITLDEKNIDGKDALGNPSSAERDTANEYGLMPGVTYTKDPTIHIEAGSEACWLFVKIENGISAIESTDKSIASQMAANWTVIDEAKGIYKYNTKVAKSNTQTDIIVFSTFTVKDSATSTELEAVKNNTIQVTAYAVQADGLDSAEKAWQASGFGA